MGNQGRAGRIPFAVCVLGILLCVILWGSRGIAVEGVQQDAELKFDIVAQLLSASGRTYDIQLTVGSQGADWEGTVRLRLDDYYGEGNCVYDTMLSLPQGSTKQFVVRIPKESIEYTGMDAKVFLLDKQSGIVAEKVFQRVLLSDADRIALGILSDSYQSLTYLDLGGEGVYYGGNELPVRLLELDQDSLASVLDSLVILVIDNYDTAVLTDEAVDRIRQWVYDGGMLIVGTGQHVERTLGGLDFLHIGCDRVNEPGEGNYNADYIAGLSRLSMAELQDPLSQYHVDEDNLIMVSPQRDGAVAVVPYALSDLGRPDQVIEGREDIAGELLRNANDWTSVKYSYGHQGYNDDYYILRRIFRLFGNGGSRLNFGGLKWIVVLYVIFVGPALYLILRSVKKQDWYWIAVPVTTLAAILLVYFAGSGFEVVNTRVYSVTVEKLSDESADAMTYMHCYDAGHRKWGLRLDERFAYAGAMLQSYYDVNDEKYYIQKEGERLSFGMNPSTGFEDGYFAAGTSRKSVAGSITSSLQAGGQGELYGTVTNGTDRDFKYFAVIFQDHLCVCRELPAGETCDLGQAGYTEQYQGYGSSAEAYLQGYMDDAFYVRKEKKDIDAIAALGTGISAVNLTEDPDAVVIIGVTENWDRTVDDNCTETSYGCVYALQ